MNALLIAATATKADCLVAGLIFGVVLMLVGRGIIWAVCNLRDERTAREAERTSPAAQEAWEQHVADSLRMTEAAVTPLPGRRLASVPPQRDGSAS